MSTRTNLTLSALLTLSATAADVRAKPKSPEGQDPNACAHVEGRPIFKKRGFNHVVSVRNTCTEFVTCEVWTNVDKRTKATLDVPAHAQREATLRQESPVSLFRAEGQCAFQLEEE